MIEFGLASFSTTSVLHSGFKCWDSHLKGQKFISPLSNLLVITVYKLAITWLDEASCRKSVTVYFVHSWPKKFLPCPTE